MLGQRHLLRNEHSLRLTLDDVRPSNTSTAVKLADEVIPLAGEWREEISDRLDRLDQSTDRYDPALHPVILKVSQRQDERGLFQIAVEIVRHVVATDVHRLTLHLEQLRDDLVFVLGQSLRNGREVVPKLIVVGLRKRLRPVEGEVEMAAPVVELVHLS